MHSDKNPLGDRIKQLRGERGHKRTRTGTVKGIREHYERKDMARIELEDEHPPAKTKGATAKIDNEFARSFDVEVPKAHTAGLKLGDRVHVHTTIEKA